MNPYTTRTPDLKGYTPSPAVCGPMPARDITITVNAQGATVKVNDEPHPEVLEESAQGDGHLLQQPSKEFSKLSQTQQRGVPYDFRTRNAPLFLV